MSTHVVAVMAPDDEWAKMKAVWDACEAAGLEVPREVDLYFDDEPPGEGRVVSLQYGEHRGVAHEWSEDSRCGYEVVLAELPEGVTKLRFYNSY